VLLATQLFSDGLTGLQLQKQLGIGKKLLTRRDRSNADIFTKMMMSVEKGIRTGADWHGGARPTSKPFTSFKWAKKTVAPNPYLAGTEERLKRAEDDPLPTTSPDRKRDLRNAITQLRGEVATLKKFSFLIARPIPTLSSGASRMDTTPLKRAITRS